MANVTTVAGLEPDHLDLRDLKYRSPLISLPPEYPAADSEGLCDQPLGVKDLLKKYSGLVRDQKKDGPCTGYALAAVISYLKWSSSWRGSYLAGTTAIKDIPEPERGATVSAEMLYHVALLYKSDATYGDHASLRDVMYAWRKHGACLEEFWPKKLADTVAPRPGWQQSCADCTTSAYYRVYQSDTLGRTYMSDIQAAIYETGAVLAGGKIIQSDWDSLRNQNPDQIPTLPSFPNLDSGAKGRLPGHAYALVGYNSEGFIILNSWGPEWGYKGFAVIRYEDWDASGEDVWVAALGVPTLSGVRASTPMAQTPLTGGYGAMRERESGSVVRERGFGIADPVQEANPNAWSLERAYNHSVVIADDGSPRNRLLEMPNGLRALEHVCYDRVLESFESDSRLKEIVIFAHGGLEPESISLKRAAVLGPFFYENGIYPIFVSGQSGFMEPLGQMLLSGVQANQSILGPSMDAAMHNVVEAWTQSPGSTSEARDAQIEKVCLRLIRPLWTQFKCDADTSTKPGGALYEIGRDIAKVLRDMKPKARSKQRPIKPGVHLIAHSAGAVLMGELLSVFKSRAAKRYQTSGIKVASCSLFGPACSVAFAERKFGGAVTDGILKWGDFHVELLSDENERRDNVAKIYGKSFLYLLSRALEDRKYAPVLGLENAWSRDETTLLREFGLAGAGDVKSWLKRASRVNPTIHSEPQILVSPNGEYRDAAHELFDNNVPLIEKTIQRIAGKLRTRVGTLKGF